MSLQGSPRSIVMRGPHSVFFTLVHANRLHVKWGVPEHHYSGLLLVLPPSPSGHVHGIATWHASDG